MELSKLGFSDVERVKKLAIKYYGNDFLLPSLLQSQESKIVKNDNKIIAFGTIRPIYEVIMVLNKDESLRDKAVALQALIDDINPGYRQIHAFVQEDSFEEILKKHFEFRNTKGISLVKDL